MNFRLYRLNRTLSERTNLFSHQSLVNRIDVSESNYRRGMEVSRLLLPFVQSIFIFRTCSFRADGNNNDVIMRTIPCVGGNNKCRALFIRSVVGEGEWQQNNVSSATLGHKLRLSDYSKNQENFGRESSSRDSRHSPRQDDFGNLFDSASLGATKVASYLRISTNQLPAQSGLKSYFAYANSLPQSIMNVTS